MAGEECTVGIICVQLPQKSFWHGSAWLSAAFLSDGLAGDGGAGAMIEGRPDGMMDGGSSAGAGCLQLPQKSFSQGAAVALEPLGGGCWAGGGGGVGAISDGSRATVGCEQLPQKSFWHGAAGACEDLDAGCLAEGALDSPPPPTFKELADGKFKSGAIWHAVSNAKAAATGTERKRFTLPPRPSPAPA